MYNIQLVYIYIYKLYKDRKLKWQLLEFHALSDHQTVQLGRTDIETAQISRQMSQKQFLKLIDKHFPKSHILHKVFNRNNVKVSYSCTSNLRNLIKQHNSKILNETRKANSDGCNCRKRNSCPLDGACLASGIVYKATVTTNIGQPKIYIGSTKHSFKTRFNNHKISLKYRKHSHSTCLSKYIWELKDKGNDHEIKWSIIKRAKPYSGKPSRLQLCNPLQFYLMSAALVVTCIYFLLV